MYGTKVIKIAIYTKSSQSNTLKVINSKDLIASQGNWFGWIALRLIVIVYNSQVLQPTNAPTITSYVPRGWWKSGCNFPYNINRMVKFTILHLKYVFTLAFKVIFVHIIHLMVI